MCAPRCKCALKWDASFGTGAAVNMQLRTRRTIQLELADEAIARKPLSSLLHEEGSQDTLNLRKQRSIVCCSNAGVRSAFDGEHFQRFPLSLWQALDRSRWRSLASWVMAIAGHDATFLCGPSEPSPSFSHLRRARRKRKLGSSRHAQCQVLTIQDGDDGNSSMKSLSSWRNQNDTTQQLTLASGASWLHQPQQPRRCARNHNTPLTGGTTPTCSGRRSVRAFKRSQTVRRSICIPNECVLWG